MRMPRRTFAHRNRRHSTPTRDTQTGSADGQPFSHVQVTGSLWLLNGHSSRGVDFPLNANVITGGLRVSARGEEEYQRSYRRPGK